MQDDLDRQTRLEAPLRARRVEERPPTLHENLEDPQHMSVRGATAAHLGLANFALAQVDGDLDYLLDGLEGDQAALGAELRALVDRALRDVATVYLVLEGRTIDS
jgi:hypothetical protein